MKLRTCHRVVFSLCASCVVSAIVLGAETATLLNWTGTNRKTVRARFVEMHEDKVTLELENGKQAEVPLERLDTASRRLALREAERQADLPIESLRKMAFVKIRNGRFKMGSPIDEPGRVTNGLVPQPRLLENGQPTGEIIIPDDFEPERRVDITRTFWMKSTEVTWSEWNAVRAHAVVQGYTDIGTGRNGYTGDNSGLHPVTEVTWLDAIKWCNLKSQIEGRQPVYHNVPDFSGASVFKNGNRTPFVNWEAGGYRLPTEAEWEFACREGRDDLRAFHSGKISETGVAPLDRNLDAVGWYAGNSGGNTHPVGEKTERVNRFGLLDMHGNVAEWCWDRVGLLAPAEDRDPRGNDKGTMRVFRGGSWADPARCCRSAYRGTFSPSPPSSCLVGFRPVCGGDPEISSSP